MMTILFRPLLITAFVLTSYFGYNQNLRKDTLYIDLHHAEKIFIDSNLMLLAQKYNIDAQKALIIQAKLWPNPNLSYGRGPFIPLYDPTSTKFLL